MKRTIISITGIILSIAVCCAMIGLFWDGYYLPNKPCRPITYPDARRTTEPFSIMSQDSLDSVLEFYNLNLATKPIFEADKGDWKMEKLNDTRYLFSCYGVDINRITTESGCVYVSLEGNYVKIDGDLARSEGSNVPCPRR